jgi:hypothetical protein
MSELHLAITELRKAAETVVAVADTLTAMFSNGESDAATVSEAKPVPPKSVTLEEVRAVLAEKSRAGHTAAVKELIAKYGSERLSDLNPAHYADLLKDAEGLT